MEFENRRLAVLTISHAVREARDTLDIYCARGSLHFPLIQDFIGRFLLPHGTQMVYINPMFGFMIKKTFYDMWDNLFAILLMNIGFILTITLIAGLMYGAGLLLPLLFPVESVVAGFFGLIGILIMVCAVYSVYAGAVSGLTRDIADGQKASFANFFTYLKETWRPSALFGAIQAVLIALLLNAANFYLGAINNLIYPLLFFILMWAYLIWQLASQYFFPLQSRFEKKLGKNMRKMFILLFDNVGFTIFGLALAGVVTLGLSLIIFILIPGLATMMLLYSVALKLRLLKYDYLEANPQANRKQIPWDTLLIEEREKTGKRSFRSLIFPWKD